MPAEYETTPLDLTAKGVEFAPWQTDVQDDDLSLVKLSFAASSWVRYPQDGFKLEMAQGSEAPAEGTLEALFLSREKQAAVRFLFNSVWAFRVLDEGGLLELWEASSVVPRPAQATFRVRGHAWQAESVLVWIHGTDKDHFSYMIATEDSCLEVVTLEEPRVDILPAVVTKLTDRHKRSPNCPEQP